MSAEEETTGPGPEDAAGEGEGKAPAKKAAAKKPAAKEKAAKAPAAEKPGKKTLRRKKAAAAKEPVATEAVADEEPTAAKEPDAAKQPAAAKEPDAAKQPAAAKEPAAAKRPTAAKEPKAAKAPAKVPAASEAKPAARPGRSSKKQAPRRRVVRAHARYVRTSARKARMICGHLRGKSVQEARAILAFTPREVARDWSKLLESAVANAESNHELLEDDLIVREAYADEGPTLKRFRPRAMGRASPIRKRTSHLTITLAPGPEPRTTKR
jgi:ribosomal protein L22